MSPPRAARHGRGRHYNGRPPSSPANPARAVLAGLVIVAVVAFVLVQLVRPAPGVSATDAAPAPLLRGAPASPAWPAQGQAAIGVQGVGLLAEHGSQVAQPIASVTKLMTAYLVLQDHPLGPAVTGPAVTITATDVATYQADAAQGDSVVAVTAGEQLNERQLLEGLLIPSGDNIAALLAAWDAGSEQAFVGKMNATARRLGLLHTHYADASGVSTQTVSTAEDQLRLAMIDMTNSAFRSIVRLTQATLPVAGLVYNVNAELGTDGIIGVKTGYTPAAGGCFTFAATTTVDGKARTVVGAVLGQPGTAAQPAPLTAAFAASTTLLTSVEPAIVQQTVLPAATVLGHLDAPWAQPVPLVTTRPVSLTGLAGARVRTVVTIPGPVSAPVPAGHQVGYAVVRLGSQRVRVPLAAGRAVPGASLGWRLTNL